MMSCEKHSSESSCTQPDLPPTSPASAISPSVAQESSFLQQPTPFLFSRPDKSIPRKVNLTCVCRVHTWHDGCHVCIIETHC